jgi:hypothetical protein
VFQRVGTDREEAMADASYLRERAQRCRTLAQVASDPEVIHQLQVWAVELERDADELERAGGQQSPDVQERRS